MRKSLIALAVVLGVGAVAAGVVSAGERTAGGGAKGEVSRAYIHGNNVPSTGVALEGYCPVAYFAVNKPVKGKPEHASTYKDVTYWFVSQEAKDAFDKTPAKFVPAYGGWCAYGIAKGDKFPVDPTAFKIVDGRLMLFLRNKAIDTLALWNSENEAANIAKADATWKKISQ